MKLYRVHLRNTGLYSIFYTVAENADEAYRKARKHLDDNDLCFRKEREMGSVELIAEEAKYPDCGTILLT